MTPQATPPSTEPAVLIFGEVLFDCFPEGRRVLGGAPFNVAWGLQGFGLRPRLLSAVGADAPGDEIRERMQAWGMLVDGVQVREDLQTGTVEVTVEEGEPSYDIAAPRAWDAIAPADPGQVSLLYHGALALRSAGNRRTFSTLCTELSAPRFFDVNLRPPHTPLQRVQEWLSGAAWVKMNLSELGELSGMPEVTLAGSDAAIDTLRERYGIGTVLLTAGADGARIRGAYGEGMLSPAPSPAEMRDAVGAGDAFAAVTVRGLLLGVPAQMLLQQAGQFAAAVCGLQGATTDDPAFYRLQESF